MKGNTSIFSYKPKGRGEPEASSERAAALITEDAVGWVAVKMLGGCEDVYTWNLFDLYCGAKNPPKRRPNFQSKAGGPIWVPGIYKYIYIYIYIHPVTIFLVGLLYF